MRSQLKSIKTVNLTRQILALGLFTLLVLGGCSTTQTNAPVTDRTPQKPSKPEVSASAKNVKSANKTSDWRPDTYLVKKGDTLLRISLELGYYYKDIAQANNIVAPYPIKVGQILQLKALKDKNQAAESTTTPSSSVASNTNNNAQTDSTASDVEIVPITTEPQTSSTEVAPIAAVAVIQLSEPKGLREVYTDEAFKKPLPTPKLAEPTVVAKAEPNSVPVVSKPNNTTEATNGNPSTESTNGNTNTEPAESKPTEASDGIVWAWPTKGKVIGNFNEGSNKGIDIAGTLGQAVNAAAPGKVIYSGSDLRGYGKLVIIKHNANYLSVYAHNSTILVKEGQAISRGQKIAEMGNTDSSHVKLHFEIRRQGKSVDPNKYLQASL